MKGAKSMKARLLKMAMGLAAVVATTGAGLAADLATTPLSGDGQPPPKYPANGIQGYRIEWTVNMASGKWTDMEQGIRYLAATGTTMVAKVPMFYRIRTMNPPPADMVYIPAGTFRMGDSFAEGRSWELPVHDVYVSGFYMDRYPVYKWLWEDVASWSETHGYDISINSATVKGIDHPAVGVSWYEAVKWCNARSEKEGLRPCYYIDPFFFNAYRTGNSDISDSWVDWNANGYRLPTDAEWEKAARGGANGYRFPWADNSIRHGRANYRADGGESYDHSSGAEYHPAYTNGGWPYTSPVDAFTPNGYGLYDMAGNVKQWCWDWHGDYTAGYQTDPHGPTNGACRVLRGGSWYYRASLARVAYRTCNVPDFETGNVGFRCARGL
jgi:formylglycine-generating enzyme required for sulfatase activity